MKLRTAIRKTVKWGGAAAVVLLVAVWVASGWWWADIWLAERVSLYIGDGRVEICQADMPARNALYPGQSFPLFDVGRAKTLDLSAAFYTTRPEPKFVWWFHREVWRVSGVPWTSTTLPFWFPTLLVLIPTTLAWSLDRRIIRRARNGLCPACGYDRRGLAGGSVCPECGAAAAALTAGPASPSLGGPPPILPGPP